MKTQIFTRIGFQMHYWRGINTLTKNISDKKKNLYKSRYILLIIFSFFLFSRLLYLDADPPPSFSLGLISDEGWWIHNSRNIVLFGQWVMDDFNQSLVISPAYAFFCFCFFKLLGVGFYSARLTSAMSGFFSLILVFVWSHKWQDQKNSAGPLITAFMMGLQSFFFFFNRVALVDTLMVFFLLMGFYLWDHDDKVSAFASGIIMFAAFLAKPFTIILYTVFPVVWLWEHKQGILKSKRIIWFVIGSGLMTLLWLYFMIPDYFQQFIDLNTRFSKDNLATSPYKILVGIKVFLYRESAGLIHPSRFMSQTIILFGLSWLLFLGFINKLRTDGIIRTLGQLHRWQVITGTWLLLGLLFFLPNPYKPERRYLFLIPPLVILISDLLRQWLYSSNNNVIGSTNLLVSNNNNWGKIILSVLFPLPFIFPLSTSVVRLMDGLEIDVVGSEWSAIAVSLVIIYLIGILISYILLKSQYVLHLNRRYIAGIIIIVYIAFHAFFWFDWLSHLSWTMKDTSIKLGEDISEDTVVMGSVSDTFCMENKGFAFASFDVDVDLFYNSDPINRFKPDYYLTIYKIEGNILPDFYLPTFRPQPVFQEQIGLFPDRQNKPRAYINVYRFIYEDNR